MDTPKQLAEDAASQIKKLAKIERIDIGLTLGSGWAKAADLAGKEIASIDASEISGFHKPSVSGHTGKLRVIELSSGKTALVVGARTHFYEGHGVDAVSHGVRVCGSLGAKVMVLTNGAGGIKPSWKPGQPVLISDHINLTATSPLKGATFVDLTDLYSSRIREIALQVDPSLDQGVYVQFPGPHYETPAEVQMAKVLGGHIVGMSTALEAIAAREAGLEVFGMSLITNLAAGIQSTPLSHAEVLEAGAEAEPVIAKLLAEIINKI